MLDASNRHDTRSQQSVLAWDLPTRLFKWALVVCIVLAWVTNKFFTDATYLHKWNGYFVLVLIVFRLLWGIVGGSTARFSSFVTWPWSAFRFFIGQLRGTSASFLGHSPIAGLMVLVLICLIGAQGLLGLFSADQDRLIVEGPLADTVSDETIHMAAWLHRLNFNAILVFAGVHIVANIAYAALKRSGYIKAMITGRKAVGDYADFNEAKPGAIWKALLCLGAATAIVFGGIVALGGHPFR